MYNKDTFLTFLMQQLSIASVLRNFTGILAVIALVFTPLMASAQTASGSSSYDYSFSLNIGCIVYPGDRVQFGNHPAIYLINDAGEMLPFPSQEVYMTWFKDFEGVTKLQPECAVEIPSPAKAPYFVNYFPGSRLVKRKISPHVYAIGQGGKIYRLKNEKAARDLFGDNWGVLIRDIGDAQWFNFYDTQEELDGTTMPDGVVVTDYGKDLYIMKQGQAHKISADVGMHIRKNARQAPAKVALPKASPVVEEVSEQELLLEAGAKMESKVHFPKQEAAVKNMLRVMNSDDLTKLHFSGSFAMEFATKKESFGSSNPTQPMVIPISGYIDHSDLSNAKTHMKVAINVPNELAPSLGFIDLEFITVDDVSQGTAVNSKTFFRFNKLPDLGELLQQMLNLPVKPDLSFLENQWIEVDSSQGTSSSLVGAYLGGSGATTLIGGSARSQQDKVLNAIAAHRLFEVVRVDQNTQVNGEDVQVIHVKMNKKALLDLTLALNKLDGKKPMSKYRLGTLRKSLSQLKEPHGTFWINTQSGFLHALYFGGTRETKYAKDSLKLNLSMDQWQGSIALPRDTMDVEELGDLLEKEMKRVEDAIDAFEQQQLQQSS